MENIVVITLKLGLLLFGAIVINIVISWMFKHLGFYKRSWVVDVVSAAVIIFWGIGMYIIFGISENSFRALRGNVIFLGWVLLGIIGSCFFLVSLRNFFKKKEILFICPNLSNLSKEEKIKVEKHLGSLRKKKFYIHFHAVGFLSKRQSSLDAFNHLTETISKVNEIHIWHTDSCINEIAFVLGVYLYHGYLFWGKNIVVVNNGGSLLSSKNTIDKILSNLEWCSF